MTCVHQSPLIYSQSHTTINKILMIPFSNNNTNLSLSFHPPNPCLLLLPRSLMLSHSPPPLPPLPIHMHPSTFNCHTQTHLSSDSTGRPRQTRFLPASWIETVLVHFLCVLNWALEDDKDEETRIFSGSEFPITGPWYWKDRKSAKGCDLLSIMLSYDYMM